MSEPMNDPLIDLAEGRKDLTVLHDGRVMTTHGPDACMGPNCCIHNPSQHPLMNAPLHWSSMLRRMFRVCEHDHLHPDPDDMDFAVFLAYAGYGWGYDGWHPCCEHNCCSYSRAIPQPRTGTRTWPIEPTDPQ